MLLKSQSEFLFPSQREFWSCSIRCVKESVIHPKHKYILGSDILSVTARLKTAHLSLEFFLFY